MSYGAIWRNHKRQCPLCQSGAALAELCKAGLELRAAVEAERETRKGAATVPEIDGQEPLF